MIWSKEFILRKFWDTSMTASKTTDLTQPPWTTFFPLHEVFSYNNWINEVASSGFIEISRNFKSRSHLPKKIILFDSMKALQKWWKLLFILSFRSLDICDALCDLVPCAQFKKREKHPWRNVTFSKVAGCSLQFY